MTIIEYKNIFSRTSRTFCLNPIDIKSNGKLKFKICGQGTILVNGKGWKEPVMFVIDAYPLNPFRNFRLKLTTSKYIPFRIKRCIQKEFDKIEWGYIISFLRNEEFQRYGE